MTARSSTRQDRWAAIAGVGSVGASYIPCCPARLLLGAGADPDRAESRGRLALLWSERASALRYRRAVLAMRALSTDDRLVLARLQREASAYDAGAARLAGIRGTRVPWLVRLLGSRRADPVIGATLATMAAELGVLHLAAAAARITLPDSDLH